LTRQQFLEIQLGGMAQHVGDGDQVLALVEPKRGVLPKELWKRSTYARCSTTGILTCGWHQ
jgi:hypothetical protein